MEKNYNLSKWLNDELTEAELAEFKADPDFDAYEKIKIYSAQLKVGDFDETQALEKVLSHKKDTVKTIPLHKNWMFRVAAILLIALGITVAMQNFTTQNQFASNGKRTSFLLPDNSEVVLNAGSEIEYKKWNWKKNRNLELHGEAYFKVAKGEKFEVKTSLGKVAVLGTQFNVKARKNRFDITCFEGRVKVNYKYKEIILTHGQSVSFENEKQVNAKATSAKPEWLENKIDLYKEKLPNITDEIQRQYNVNISIKSGLSNELFTGKIPTDNLDIALEIIATTYNLEIKKIDPNTIIFEKK
ncbi:FecR family protein [Flavobacterium sp.]|uniref:FecR family protein n=1 Tax=Flavobacterium sp. TaxID=239 RepID=UPI00286E2B50|nr:FecR family protein [Flavobacterium sp.]